jgi:hypothetical protein
MLLLQSILESNMYHIDTFTTRNLAFGATISLPALLVSHHLLVRSALLTPGCDPDRDWSDIPSCGRDLDALFHIAWLILPWTSQTACVGRASLSNAVTLVGTGYVLGQPVLFDAKI